MVHLQTSAVNAIAFELLMLQKIQKQELNFNSNSTRQKLKVIAAPKNSKLQFQFIDHLKRRAIPTNPSSTSISFFPQATFHYKTLAARTSHPWPRAPATGNNNPHFAKTALKPNYMHQVVNTFGKRKYMDFCHF